MKSIFSESEESPQTGLPSDQSADLENANSRAKSTRSGGFFARRRAGGDAAKKEPTVAVAPIDIPWKLFFFLGGAVALLALLIVGILSLFQLSSRAIQQRIDREGATAQQSVETTDADAKNTETSDGPIGTTTQESQSTQAPIERLSNIRFGAANPEVTWQENIQSEAYYLLDVVSQNPDGLILYRLNENSGSTTILAKIADTEKYYVLWAETLQLGEYVSSGVGEVHESASYLMLELEGEENEYRRVLITREQTRLPIQPSSEVVYERVLESDESESPAEGTPNN